jgi:hypothetical protein
LFPLTSHSHTDSICVSEGIQTDSVGSKFLPEKKILEWGIRLPNAVELVFGATFAQAVLISEGKVRPSGLGQ